MVHFISFNFTIFYFLSLQQLRSNTQRIKNLDNYDTGNRLVSFRKVNNVVIISPLSSKEKVTHVNLIMESEFSQIE